MKKEPVTQSGEVKQSRNWSPKVLHSYSPPKLINSIIIPNSSQDAVYPPNIIEVPGAEDSFRSKGIALTANM